MPENDIMAGYCSAMAHRIMELLNRLGVKEKFVITGGIAKNEGIVKRLEKELGIKTADRVWYKKEYIDRKYPFDTQLAGGFGAALFGQLCSRWVRQRAQERPNSLIPLSPGGGAACLPAGRGEGEEKGIEA